MQHEALLVGIKASPLISAEHEAESLAEDPPKVPYALIFSAKLIFKRFPTNELWPLQLDPVQALREPSIHVKRHGRVRQRC